MSGEGPESIPTSADPRSKRPTKKRALTPVSAQAASVDALFAKPDRDTSAPELSAVVAARRAAGVAAPEIVTNVQGSSAGAGSGEFHVYKAARRREYERLRAMDAEVRSEKASEEFDKEKAERDARDAERTRKNREKRDKKKKRRGPEAAAPLAKIPRREMVAEEKGDGQDSDTRGLAGTDNENQQNDLSTGIVIHDDD